MSIAFRIAHISDTHISGYGHFLEGVFDKAIKEINALRPVPDVVVHSGDITNYGVLSEYELAESKLAFIKPRLITVPGNHDEKNYGSELYMETFGPVDVRVDVGRATIFCMNSPEPDRDAGRLGRRRQSFLEEELKTLRKDRIKIIVFHHHLVPVPGAGREENVLEDAGDILDMVLQHDVDLVLMGHRHMRRTLKIEGSILVNAATLSSIRTRGRVGNSFNIIDILEDGTTKVYERKALEKQMVKMAEYRKETV